MTRFAQEMTRIAKEQGKTFTQVVYEFAENHFNDTDKKRQHKAIVVEARSFACLQKNPKQRLHAFFSFLKDRNLPWIFNHKGSAISFFDPEEVWKLQDKAVDSVLTLLDMRK